MSKEAEPLSPQAEPYRDLLALAADAPVALAIGAFAVGVIAGATLAIGLLVAGRGSIGQLDVGKPRPRRLLIGNLEIEERGDDTRFRVD